jgi:DNA-binding transcriptional MerR regulator
MRAAPYDHAVARTRAADAAADADARYQIGEVADRTGVTQRTLRFYEEKGLLKPPERMDGGFRLYSDIDVERIQFIKRLQDLLGFTLSEIKEMVEAEELRVQIVATFDPDRELPARRKRAEQILGALQLQLDVVERKTDQLIEMRAEIRKRLLAIEERHREIVEAMDGQGAKTKPAAKVAR